MITVAQEKKIQELIQDRTPDQLKLAYALWTRQAVSELIEALYGIRLALANGKKLRLVANNLDRDGLNHYVQSVTLNGVDLPNAWFRHDQIKDGATLVFTMGSAPTNWGRAVPPPSMSDPGYRNCPSGN
jgi:hypothetical protein